MKAARVRFLERGEEAVLPAWTRMLPKQWREKYLVSYVPYRIEETEAGLTGILQVQREGAMAAEWRQGAKILLSELEQRGAGIVVPPAEGEFPREILPFAEGRRLAVLFAFDGAVEALKRQGKEPSAAAYLLSGGEPALWRVVLASMGNEVNRLGILTTALQEASVLAEELYEERGLVVEVFASPKHAAFREADAILSCGMEQRPYEHTLKRGCFWLDLAGNRAALRRILRTRPDVAAAEGYFFHVGEAQKEGRAAEAEAFLQCEAFRSAFGADVSKWDAAALRQEVQAAGFAVSGFSAFGKRVKIQKI